MAEPGTVHGYLRVLGPAEPRMSGGAMRARVMAVRTCCGLRGPVIVNSLSLAARHDRCLDCVLREGGWGLGYDEPEASSIDSLEDFQRALGPGALDGCGTLRAAYAGE